MRGTERVVFAFGALGEARQPAALAQRTDALAPAGEDLVRISLMADVPDQPVARRVEHPVQSNRQIDDAEARAEVAAGDGYRIDGLTTQLCRQLRQILFRNLSQLVRGPHLIEQRRCRARTHRSSLLTRAVTRLCSAAHYDTNIVFQPRRCTTQD